MRNRISKIASAVRTGHEIYKDHQEVKEQKRIDDEKIRRFGSLSLAHAHEARQAEQRARMRQLHEEADQMRAESVRYPEVMGRNMKRVAIVTNFSGEDHDYHDLSVTAQATAEKLSTVFNSASVIVVEALAESPQDYKLPDFENSAGLLAEAIDYTKVTNTEVVAESYQSQFMTFTPAEFQQRVEHYEKQYESEEVGYIAVTSALQLQCFGTRVNHSILGAHGETYEQIVRGGIIVPETPNIEDPWTIVPRG